MSSEDESSSEAEAALSTKSSREDEVDVGGLEGESEAVDGTDTLVGKVASNSLRPAILRSMYESPDLKRFCDVIFMIEGSECPAHKVVLASVSQVFQAMFTNGMKESGESSENQQKISLSEVQVNAFKEMLAFVYLGEISVNGKTVFELLKVADMYQVKGLFEAIDEFLVSRVTVENWVEMWTHGAVYTLSKLEETVLEIVACNFREVCYTVEFEKSPLEFLEKLLNLETMQAHNALVTLKAVVKWISVNEKRRMSNLDALLPAIPISRLIGRKEITEAGVELVDLSTHSAVARQLLKVLLRKEPEPPMPNVVLSRHHLAWISASLENEKRKTIMEFSEQVSGIKNPLSRKIVTKWRLLPQGFFDARLLVYPRGHDGKENHISVYLQLRATGPAFDDERRVPFWYSIFLVNKRGCPWKSHDSLREFSSSSDGWGTREFESLENIYDPSNSLYHEGRDCIRIGVVLMRKNEVAHWLIT